MRLDSSSRGTSAIARAARVAHLLRGANDDPVERGRIEARRHVEELRLEEYQAEGVFEGLHLGVGRQVFLADDRLHAFHGRGVVAGADQHLAELVGLLLLQRLAPAQVGGPAGRRRRAGYGPPAVVVAVGGQPQWLARVGSQALDPVGHQLGVHDLLRAGARADRDEVRVIGIAGVDRGQGAGEALGAGHDVGLTGRPLPGRPLTRRPRRQLAPRWLPNQLSVRLHASAAASALYDGRASQLKPCSAPA